MKIYRSHGSYATELFFVKISVVDWGMLTSKSFGQFSNLWSSFHLIVTKDDKIFEHFSWSLVLQYMTLTSRRTSRFMRGGMIQNSWAQVVTKDATCPRAVLYPDLLIYCISFPSLFPSLSSSPMNPPIQLPLYATPAVYCTYIST